MRGMLLAGFLAALGPALREAPPNAQEGTIRDIGIFSDLVIGYLATL